MEGQSQATDATPPITSERIVRELRAGARAGEAPSRLLRRLVEESGLSAANLRRALEDAFCAGVGAIVLAEWWAWPSDRTKWVTAALLDEKLGAEIAATRDVWAADGWPFADSEFATALSTERLRRGEAPILVVEREAHVWWFFDGRPLPFAPPEEFWVGNLWAIHRCDPSVGELCDLEPGWVAERNARGQPWRRRRADTPPSSAEPNTAPDPAGT